MHGEPRRDIAPDLTAKAAPARPPRYPQLKTWARRMAASFAKLLELLHRPLPSSSSGMGAALTLMIVR